MGEWRGQKYRILSPEGNCESSTREGPLDSLSILLYVIDVSKLGLQKYTTVETREKPQWGWGFFFFRFLNEASPKKSPTPKIYYFYLRILD